jgi:hypothetical protein
LTEGETLDALLAHVRVAHHIPGRIRLRLAKPSGGAGPRASGKTLARFCSALGAAPGIHAVRLNWMAHSCTVEYDSLRVANEAWSDLFAGVHSPHAHALREMLTHSYRQALKVTA